MLGLTGNVTRLTKAENKTFHYRGVRFRHAGYVVCVSLPEDISARGMLATSPFKYIAQGPK